MYASPLIVAGHVLVATEDNTVYSLDLYSGAVVWKAHLGPPVEATSLQCGNIGPVTGITGTPAVDIAAGRVYTVAFLAGHHHVLFTLSLADGTVIAQQDVDPPGSDPSVQQQRGALARGSGYVYITLGGLYGDCGAYHGYIEAIPQSGGPASGTRMFGRRGAGIWSSAGPTIGPSGDVYVVTGNGSAGSSFDYSNSVVQLSSDLLATHSYFAPSNWSSLNATDTDLGSVGVTLLPNLGVALTIGKAGVAYLLRAGQLGGMGGEIASKPVCSGAWGGTAVSGSIVFVPCADGLVALSLTATAIAILWRAAHPMVASPIVSAGAVWAIEAATAKLYALDPLSGAVLYSTSLGSAEHFSTPAATEGFVVAPAGSRVVAISTSN